MCCDSPSPPPAPDYTGAANATAAASKEVATQQNWANRPNQITPWGSVTWASSAATDPATGQPVTQWQQTQSLNPTTQNALDAQLNIQRGRNELAGSFMDRVNQAYAQPMDYSAMPARRGMTESMTPVMSPDQFSRERDDYIRAQRELLQPRQDRQQAQLDQRLANQGLKIGSEAYSNAQADLQDAFRRDDLAAIEGGQRQQLNMRNAMLANQGQAFNQAQSADTWGNTNRAQAIAEEAQRRGMSLNEMNAVLTRQQVTPPQMPGFLPGSTAQRPPDYLGAMQAQGRYNADLYNSQIQEQAGLWSGLGSLAGAGAQLYGMGYGIGFFG
jgi:hypothetical protein